MRYLLIATGTARDIQRLEEYQRYFPEGSEGYLDLELRHRIAADIVGWLDSKLEAAGVPEHRVKTEGRHLLIFFKVEVAPLALIARAIAAIILLLGLIVAWKLFRLEPEPVIGIGVGMIILIVLAVLVVAYLIATRGRLAAGPVEVGR